MLFQLLPLKHPASSTLVVQWFNNDPPDPGLILAPTRIIHYKGQVHPLQQERYFGRQQQALRYFLAKIDAIYNNVSSPCITHSVLEYSLFILKQMWHTRWPLPWVHGATNSMRIRAVCSFAYTCIVELKQPTLWAVE
jgi:hypothetical protein